MLAFFILMNNYKIGKMWKYAKNMLKKCVTNRFVKKIYVKIGNLS